MKKSLTFDFTVKFEKNKYNIYSRINPPYGSKRVSSQYIEVKEKKKKIPLKKNRKSPRYKAFLVKNARPQSSPI